MECEEAGLRQDFDAVHACFFRPDCSVAADALQSGGTGTRRSKIMAFGHSFSPLFDGSPCGSFAVHAFNGRMAALRAHRFDSEPIL
jgi:hypothetical protein